MKREEVWGSVDIAPLLMTSALHGREWSASHSTHFSPGTYWIGSWLDSRAGLDAVDQRNTSASAGNQTPVFQPAL
jgi:hypothetical protein